MTKASSSRDNVRHVWRAVSMRLFSPPKPSQVILHVYDVGTERAIAGANRLLRGVGAGAYHAAVEVNGCEWSYGHANTGTGVFSCRPTACSFHTYREAVLMGDTCLTPMKVRLLLRRLEVEWPGKDYDLLRKNCCHFCDEFCQRLGVGCIPSWLTNLAGAGATIADGVKDVERRACKVAVSLDDRFDFQGKAASAADTARCLEGCAAVVKEFFVYAAAICAKRRGGDKQMSIRKNSPQKANAELICHRWGGIF